MFRKILVATDLSEASMPALRTAISMCRRFGAHLVALHVCEYAYESRHWFVPLEAWERELHQNVAKREEEAAERTLREQLLAATPEPLPEGMVELVSRRGLPADLIVAAAGELGVDLLIVGTHGRTGLSHAMLGSIAERVVRTAPCPVLVVRGVA